MGSDLCVLVFTILTIITMIRTVHLWTIQRFLKIIKKNLKGDSIPQVQTRFLHNNPLGLESFVSPANTYRKETRKFHWESIKQH